MALLSNRKANMTNPNLSLPEIITKAKYKGAYFVPFAKPTQQRYSQTVSAHYSADAAMR